MDNEKKQKKEFLDYENGEIKRVEPPPTENFNDFVDSDEDLGPIADLLKDINKEETGETESDIENIGPKRKMKKQYIDLREHKLVDQTTESEDSYVNESPPKEKKQITLPSLPSLHIKLSSYTVVVGIMALAIVFFLVGQRDNTHVPKVKETPKVVATEPSSEATSDPTLEELTQLSNMALKYTGLIDTLSGVRDSEIKVTYGYIDGSYTKDQVRSMIAQAALNKENLLKDLEGESVLPCFSGLNTLAQRFVRSELNSSKQVIRDIDTSQKPVDIYTTFSGGTSSVNTHITNMCNELETLLKNYGISYTRSGNKFSF